jgi:phosphotriesterase-related protein
MMTVKTVRGPVEVDALRTRVREQVAPNWHFAHMHQEVLPTLRRAGIGEDRTTAMLADNNSRGCLSLRVIT